MNADLVKPISKNENCTATFAINPSKAPGVDMFTGFFFKGIGLSLEMTFVEQS